MDCSPLTVRVLERRIMDFTCMHLGGDSVFFPISSRGFLFVFFRVKSKMFRKIPSFPSPVREIGGVLNFL